MVRFCLLLIFLFRGLLYHLTYYLLCCCCCCCFPSAGTEINLFDMEMTKRANEDNTTAVTDLMDNTVASDLNEIKSIVWYSWAALPWCFTRVTQQSPSRFLQVLRTYLEDHYIINERRVNRQKRSDKVQDSRYLKTYNRIVCIFLINVNIMHVLYRQ
jgi:hypothetical protein